MLVEELPAWSYVQGILHDLRSDPKKKPSYKRAVNLHFLGEESDFEMILNLEPHNISKIKLITGSIRRNKDDTETISINFFGKRLTVSKKISKHTSDDDQPDDRESALFSEINDDRSPFENHKKRMSHIFEHLVADDEESKDIRSCLQKHRNKTHCDSPTKLLNTHQPKRDVELEFGIVAKDCQSEEAEVLSFYNIYREKKMNISSLDGEEK